MRVLVSRFLLAAAILYASACDRSLEKWVDPADEPARPERPVRVPGLEQRQARSPFQPAPRAAALPSAAGATISGTLILGEGEKAPPDALVFVVARTVSPGPPLAALRIPVARFPVRFEIGPENVMLPGQPFVGPILLSARIDSDGDPLTREPSDPVAIHPEPVEPGASGLELVLRNPG
ncbi:MAG: hypothetical protein GY725_04010 [bacterium]|nr:hypothetical protein [bacterium]